MRKSNQKFKQKIHNNNNKNNLRLIRRETIDFFNFSILQFLLNKTNTYL